MDSPAVPQPGLAGPEQGSGLAQPDRPARSEQLSPPGAGRMLLGWLAATGIGLATLTMIAVPAERPAHRLRPLHGQAAGLPWWLPVHLPLQYVAPALWAAAIIGGCGVMTGIVAVSRGARPSARVLIAAGFIATALFTVLPPTGSTDSLDYAAYGRIMVLGHSPYVMTPDHLVRVHDPIGRSVPVMWRKAGSAYGPLASAEEWAAAELGGTSVLRIVFWLKLWNALAFGVVALVLDRMLRSDATRRARAHLLWTVNPLLLWCLIEGGHVDGIAAAAGFLGLAVLTADLTGRSATFRALAAGLLVGAATDIKVTFALFGLGVAWALRRSRAGLAATAVGALAVLVPSYLWFGRPAVTALSSRRAYSTTDNIYELFARPFGYLVFPHIGRVAVVMFVLVAGLLLWRLPDGFPSRPAVRPALALSFAWLLTFPYQEPWFDTMAFCLLALYPASRLDWPLLARLIGGMLVSLPGVAGVLPAEWVSVRSANELFVVPLIRLAVLAAVVYLCLSAEWRAHPPMTRSLT